jgi:hypothetical protein
MSGLHAYARSLTLVPAMRAGEIAIELMIGERPGKLSKLRKLSKPRHIKKTMLTGSLKMCVSYESGKSRNSGQSGKSKEVFENLIL